MPSPNSLQLPGIEPHRPLPEGEAFHRASNSSLFYHSSDRSRPTTRSGTLRNDDASRSRCPSNMVTPEEYHSLPPSIQKKYFSSVERLRIAQQSAAQKRRKQSPSTATGAWLSPKPSMDSLRPKTAHTFNPSSLATQARKSQYFRSAARTDADVDEEQALRFLALPEKVKRSHFTQEELVLLTESSERALASLSWTSDAELQRQMTLDRNSSVSSSHFRPPHSGKLVEDLEKDWHIEMETESVTSSEQLGEKDIESRTGDAQRRQGSVCSTQSANPLTKESGRRSFPKRRAMSLAPLPLPPPTLRPAVPPLPTSATSDCILDTTQETTPDENVSSTKYYKDSEARQKLRECLASPEKFDEALEFGFPFERAAVERSISVTSSTAPALQPDSDALSVSDSKDEQDEGCSSQGPRTPSMGNDLFDPSFTHHSSLDSGVALPYASIKPSVRSISPDICGREMTLRMTLTRPDLRASEQELYAAQRKQVSGVEVETADPLALEALPFCDDHTGAHGAFAVSKASSGGFMKAFKNFRIR